MRANRKEHRRELGKSDKDLCDAICNGSKDCVTKKLKGKNQKKKENCADEDD